MLTPYQFAGNTPIGCIDIDGLEPTQKVMGNNLYSPVLQVENTVSGTYHNSNWYFQRIEQNPGHSDPYWVASRLRNWEGDRDYVYYDERKNEWISYVPEGYVDQERKFKENAITLGEFGKKGEQVIVASIILASTGGSGADAALEYFVNGEESDIVDVAFGLLPAGGKFKLLIESGKAAVSAIVDVNYEKGKYVAKVSGAEYLGVEGDNLRNKSIGKTGLDLFTDLLVAKGFPVFGKVNSRTDDADVFYKTLKEIFNFTEKTVNKEVTDEILEKNKKP